MPRKTELPLIASLELRLQQSAASPARIVEAFDHLKSGVVLCRADVPFVFCNRRFRKICRLIAGLLVPGTPYIDVARALYQRGFNIQPSLTKPHTFGTKSKNICFPTNEITNTSCMMKFGYWSLTKRLPLAGYRFQS